LPNFDPNGIRLSPLARLQLLERYVGFTETDWSALRESAKVLGPKLPSLLDALYDQILAFEDTRRILLPDGVHDETYIAIRKEHLTEWVLKTVATDLDRGTFATYLQIVGMKHTKDAGDPTRTVPPRYLVAFVGFLQAAIWSTLFDLLPSDVAAIRRIGLAWSKMLIIQLEIFLKEVVPSYPEWDER